MSSKPSVEYFTENCFKVLQEQVLKRQHYYKYWHVGEKIKLREFQKEVATEAKSLFEIKPIVSIEVYCAGGKTILSGFIAIDYLKANPNSKVVFISPKRASFRHFYQDLRRVLHTFGLDPNMVHARENPARDSTFPPGFRIYIVTPYDIVAPLASEGERKVIDETLKRTALVIADEVHGMPQDTEEETKIIGQIEPTIRKKAMSFGSHVLTMTGTHYRSSDEKLPFGIEKPDIKRTAQQLILAGVLPVLYGFAVPIEIKVKNGEIKRSTDTIHLAFARRKMTRYLNKVAKVILETVKIEQDFASSVKAKSPGGHCIFVSRQEQAVKICEILNEQLGREAFVPYVSDEITAKERPDILEKIKDGRLLGYATVMLGVESLNVPRLKYCHLVARITSDNKLMQGLGRVMRLPDDDDCKLVKDKAIVIDYQVKKGRILLLAKGLRDLNRLGESEEKDQVIGGLIFRAPTEGPEIENIGLDELEAWMTKEAEESWEKRIEEIKRIGIKNVQTGTPLHRFLLTWRLKYRAEMGM